MEKKQIVDELATDIFSMLRSDAMSRAMASMLYDLGWRKQSQGEWIDLPDYENGWFQNGRRTFPKSCSVCGGVISYGPYKFCPKCGAKMKGGE